LSRTIVILISAAALAAAGALLWLRPWQPGAGAPPAFARAADQNVLIVTIDTLRADALGSYGGRAATPHLDRLAAEGLRFSFAHAHAVVTLPSHASILTGRYPFDHGVRDNSGYRLDEAADTIAEMARGRGMATGAFVGAFPLDRQFGLDQGFDVYDDVGGLGRAEAEFALAERRAEAVVTAARGWIDGQSRPWLAWVHVFDPHAPYAPPAPFDREYAGNLYAGEVAYVDRALGPLLDAARSSARPTLVIVTSDHGEGMGEHGEITHGTFAYESTLKVPLIVAQVPGQGASRQGSPGRGAVVDAPARHIDLVPTILDALGAEAPAGLPGRSLLAGAAAVGVVSSYFEAMTPMLTRGWAPLSGVMRDREKYIDLPIEELYDLAADPGERRNLAPSAASRARTLAAELKGFGAGPPGEQRAENAEVRARLESLGYVSGGGPRKTVFTDDDDPKRLIELDRLMLEGIDLYGRGRVADAIAAYRRVVDARPGMPMAWRRLAFMQWEMGDVRGAIATLREGLERGGREVEMEVRLATYLTESGALAEGTSMLERVVSADPRRTDALNALGIAYARAGRDDEALATFARILAIDARDVHAHENIGTVHLQRGDMTAAAASFTRALEHAPNSSRAHAGLGVVALDAGRRDEAIAHWRRAVELDRRNFDALFNLATELVNAGRMAEARPYLELFVRTAPRAFYARDIDRLRPLVRQ
jgi:choline-sulfatase